MKTETLISLLTEMADMVDRPGGCEGGGAILHMAATEIERLASSVGRVAHQPDIRPADPTTD